MNRTWMGLFTVTGTLKRARFAALAVAFILTGCTSQKPATSPSTTSTPPTRNRQLATPRPAVAPPAFRVFHTTDSSITLVTSPNASDEEIEALIWQLRDAAHAHTFANLKINQTIVDARKPTVWFHIYRGPKCASEKYTDGAPPCGSSYHAAGDYTLGGGASNPTWDSGLLIRDDDHETRLWDSEEPSLPPIAKP